MKGFCVDGSIVNYTKVAAYLGAAFTISVGCIGPAIGQAMVASKALESVGKNPESYGNISKMMILPLILIETGSIYCLIISLMLLFFS